MDRRILAVVGLAIIVLLLTSHSSNSGAVPSFESVATPIATESPTGYSSTASPAPPVAAYGETPSPTDTPVVKVTPITYRQFDDKWTAVRYGFVDGDTIRRWGCGPSVMAMVVATLRDPSVDPIVASQWSEDHGYFTNEFESGKTLPGFFTEFAEQYGLSVREIGSSDLRALPEEGAHEVHEEALAAIEQGDWVIALMGKGHWTSEAHFVLWYDVDGEDVLIVDPNSKREDKAQNLHSLFIETVMRYWIIDVDPSGIPS